MRNTFRPAPTGLDQRLMAVCILSMAMSGPGSAQVQERTDPESGRRNTSVRFLRAPSIRLNPNPRAPLAAVVELAANKPVRADLTVSDGARSRTLSLKCVTRSCTLTVLGLSPARSYGVIVSIRDAEDNVLTWPEPLRFATAPLPGDFPPLRVEVCEPDKMEPGLTLFNATRYEAGTRGLILAVDERGEVVWYFRADHAIGFVTRLRSGNLLYLHRSAAVEIDWLGNVVRQYTPTGPGGLTVPGTIPVNTDSFHHDLVELSNGNFLVLSTELRRLPRYPSSEIDRGAPLKTADVAGDLIVEFAPDGRIVDQISLFDILDPYRIGYGSLDGFWNSLYRDLTDDTKDWTHANSLFHDPVDDSILLSLRHQDALIKVSRKTRGLEWILGNPGGWSFPWSQHLLMPDEEMVWPYHQHAATVTPEGTVLLFDNGNFRARPFEQPVPTAQSYSRAVEYRVDPIRRVVSQVWSYGGPHSEAFYSPFGGAAEYLPGTGNILMTDSARITDEQGMPTENAPAARRWARIVEVVRSSPARKVFELIVGDQHHAGQSGWSVYRSRRIPAPHSFTLRQGQEPDESHVNP